MVVLLLHHNHEDFGHLLAEDAALGNNAVQAVELAGKGT